MTAMRSPKHPSLSAILRMGLLAAVVVGCGPIGCQREETTAHTTVDSVATSAVRRIVPLAALRSFAPDTVSTRGDPRTYMRTIAGATQPVVASSDSFAFRLRIEPSARSSIEARAELFGRGEHSVSGAARFWVGSAEGRDQAIEVLWEQTLESSHAASEPFEVAVPVSAQYVEIGMEVATQSGLHGQEGAFIMPRLVTELEREPPSTSADLPDVLLLTLDTTRQDVLGVYGGEAETPTLARLAREGVLARNAHAVAFGTSPSHSSLLTSKQAVDHGVYSNQSILGEEHETLAESLASAGYSTGAFISGEPLNRSLGFAQGFDFFDDLLLSDSSSGLGSFSHFERRADRTVDRFLEWFGGRGKTPVFAWLHFFDPHQPYAPPEGFASALDPSVRALFEDEQGFPLSLKKGLLSGIESSHLEVIDQTARQRYVEEIQFLDAQLGRLLEALDAAGTLDNTLIVVVADHGENFMERAPEMAYRHRGLFTEVTRLPLILKLPRQEAKGLELDFLIGNVDIAPTILDVLALAPPPGFAGRSFLPWIRGEKAAPFRELLVSEGGHEREIAVRTERWIYREALRPPGQLTELGYGPDRGELLFHSIQDPLQKHDVASENASTVEVLRLAAEKFRSLGKAEEDSKLDSPEHLEALRALGYIE